jgi:FkbM family methyltransferase
MTPTLLGWARSALAPRERLLPGLGARLATRPRLVTAILVALRRIPGAGRHVSRPLIRRMATRLQLPVAGGFRMHVDTGEPMGRVLAATGVWEPHVTAVFRRLLSPGDVCVDVGAYSGYFTLLASRLVGTAGHVYALEPAEQTSAELVANLELNGISNVSVLRIAAGAADEEARFDDRPPGSSIRSSLRGATEPGTLVQMRTIASLLSDVDASRLRLVKIDVEGHEVAVLRGLIPLLEHGTRPAILVELHAGVVAEAVDLLMQLALQYGLKAYNVGDEDEGAWTGSAVELARLLEPQNERHLLLAQ